MGFIFTGASRVIDTPVGVSVPNFCYGACADPAFQSQEVDFVLPTASPSLGPDRKVARADRKIPTQISVLRCLPANKSHAGIFVHARVLQRRD